MYLVGWRLWEVIRISWGPQCGPILVEEALWKQEERPELAACFVSPHGALCPAMIQQSSLSRCEHCAPSLSSLQNCEGWKPPLYKSPSVLSTSKRQRKDSSNHVLEGKEKRKANGECSRPGSSSASSCFFPNFLSFASAVAWMFPDLMTLKIHVLETWPSVSRRWVMVGL